MHLAHLLNRCAAAEFENFNKKKNILYTLKVTSGVITCITSTKNTDLLKISSL